MVICRGAWQCARDQFPRYADHCGLGLININIGFNFLVLSENFGGRIAMRPYRNYAVTLIIVGWV
jgi:hypothetical protein